MLGLARSTSRYVSARRPRIAEEEALLELAHAHPGIGYQQLHNRMRRAGWKMNRKRAYRLYKAFGLERRKKRSSRRYRTSGTPAAPTVANHTWAMDFMSDRLVDGRTYRLFAVIDQATRVCFTIDVNRSMPATRVVQVLTRIAATQGLPHTIVCDNGPEYRSRTLEVWAARNTVTLHFIDPGKPTQNAFAESFNGTFRQECLDLSGAETIHEAQEIVETWRCDYNEHRPHTSLNRRTPREQAAAMPVLEFRPLLDTRPTRGDNLRLMEKLKTQEAAFPTFPQAPPPQTVP